MVEIISVRFKEGGKQYYFNPNGQQFQVGDGVIVDTTRGTEYGLCTHGNSMIDEIELMAPLRPVVRKATQEDKLTLERNKEKEKKAFAICQEKIAQHGLDMKLVEAEYSFEGNKVLFFFTSDGRVDFRALVKDLAGTIHARIELRQIGVRDEARMLGGLGICGRPFCCAQFLDEFQPVSIKMAKTQNLSLNPTKISGACGRLMALSDPPTAIFAISDVIAAGVVQRLLRLQKIPGRDVDVFGFDNTDISRMITPTLSTIQQPGYLMGKLATELLFEKMEDLTAPSKTIFVPHELIFRETTRKAVKSEEEGT